MTKKAKTAPQKAVTLPVIPERKICILGTTPSRSLAPFGDDSWEFWTIGPGGKDNNRWDALLELHGPSTWPDGFKEYIGQISTQVPESRFIGEREVKKRIITMDRMPGWSDANVGYPKAYMIGKYRRMWFSSQISWALTLAIEEGATDIGLYGIDLEAGEEYEAQFEGARHFIDMFSVAGVRFHIPGHCGLFRDPDPYPDRWESVEALYVQSKVHFLEPMLGQHQHALSQLVAEVNNLDGQIGALKWARDSGLSNEAAEARLKELEAAYPQRHGAYLQTQATVHRIEGELEFARHWLRMFVHKGRAFRHDLTNIWACPS